MARKKLSEYRKLQKSFIKQKKKLKNVITEIEKRGLDIPNLNEARKTLKIKGTISKEKLKVALDVIAPYMLGDTKVSISRARKWKKVEREVFKKIKNKDKYEFVVNKVKQNLKWEQQVGSEKRNKARRLLSKAFELFQGGSKEFRYEIRDYINYIVDEYGNTMDDDSLTLLLEDYIDRYRGIKDGYEELKNATEEYFETKDRLEF